MDWIRLERALCVLLVQAKAQDLSGSIVWANDNKTLFYVKKNKLDRPYQVYRYELGGEEELIYQEDDEVGGVGIKYVTCPCFLMHFF